jgi:hypothetical protein
LGSELIMTSDHFLPSWNDSVAIAAILDFVVRVSSTRRQIATMRVAQRLRADPKTC